MVEVCEGGLLVAADRRVTGRGSAGRVQDAWGCSGQKRCGTSGTNDDESHQRVRRVYFRKEQAHKRVIVCKYLQKGCVACYEDGVIWNSFTSFVRISN